MNVRVTPSSRTEGVEKRELTVFIVAFERSASLFRSLCVGE